MVVFLEQYRRFRKTMSYAVRKRRPLAERLWEKVTICAHGRSCKTCCWLYQGMQYHTYGTISFFQENGTMRSIGTHCAAYLVTYGILSDTLMVLHKCPLGVQKRCCNPWHLKLGDGSENTQDMLLAGGKPGSRIFTNEEVERMRMMYGEYSQKMLAEIFLTSLTTISEIINGITYQEAGGPLKKPNGRKKSHCHKGHILSEDNIKLTRSGKIRNCRICYMETNRIKARRRLNTHRDLINAQARARRGSTIHRFTHDEIAIIKGHFALGLSYRKIAAIMNTNYSTIKSIHDGTYGGSRFAGLSRTFAKSV